MVKFIKWSSLNSIFLALIYFGFFASNPDANIARVAVFAAWLAAGLMWFIGLALLLISDEALENMKERVSEKEHKSLERWAALDVIFDIMVGSLFVYSGYIILPTLYVIGSLLENAATLSIINEVEKDG